MPIVYRPSIVNKIAAAGAAQTLAFLPDGQANAYDLTMSANLTLTFSGGIPGIRQQINLLLRQPAAYTLTINGVKWHNNSTPTFSTTANTVIELTISTWDGGATIIAK